MEYPVPAELSVVGRRKLLLDKAFVTADFSGGMLATDQDDCMSAARTFLGDFAPLDLPKVDPPSTPNVIKELERGEELRDIPLPYLWHTLQTLRGVRNPAEVAADGAVKVTRVLTFLPELAIVAATSLIGRKSPRVANVLDIATSPITHADDMAKALAIRSREQLAIQVHRLIVNSFGEDFYHPRDQAPWLVVHIMHRVVRLADSETLPWVTGILVDALHNTFYASSRRTAFRVAPNIKPGHRQTAEAFVKEQRLSQHPIESLIYDAQVYGLETALRQFSEIRNEQRSAYSEKQREALAKPTKKVRPSQEVDADRYQHDIEYGRIMDDPKLLAAVVEEYGKAGYSTGQTEDLAQALAALAELSHLPIGAYKKFGLDYRDANTQRFLSLCAGQFAQWLPASRSLGIVRMLADTGSADAGLRARSPYSYIDPGTRDHLLDRMCLQAMRHFNLDPAKYRRSEKLQRAMLEAYMYHRTSRGDVASDSEAMAEVRRRRAKRFLQAIDGIPGVPLEQLEPDIQHARRQRSRPVRVVTGFVKSIPFR